MKPYLTDRCERLPGAIDAGLSPAAAARIFGVCASTLRRWRQRQRTTGTVAVRPRPGRLPRIGPAQAPSLQAQVAAHPEATLAQHCARWETTQGVRLNIATISRTIRRLGVTVKKSPARHGAG